MTMIQGGRRVDGLGPEHNPEPIHVSLDRARDLAVHLEGENAAMRERMTAAHGMLTGRCYCAALCELGATGDDECTMCRIAALLDPSIDDVAGIDALFDKLPIGGES